MIFLILFIALFILYLKPETGVDNLGENITRTNFSRTEDNETIEPSAITESFFMGNMNDPAIKSPSSGGGDDKKEKGEVPKEVLDSGIWDTDFIDLSNGVIWTRNYFVKGNCYDEENEEGKLYDTCEGNLAKEYYLEEDKCVSEIFNCSSFTEYYNGFFEEPTISKCLSGECIVKINGTNALEPGRLLYQMEIYDDFCEDDLMLREYYIADYGGAYGLIDCREEYGGDSYCSENVCVIVEEEKEIFSCDSFCKGLGREDYIGGNFPICSQGQELISHNSTIQCCCTPEPMLAWDIGGYNITSKGECIDSIDFFEDSCLDNKTLKEYYVPEGNPYYCTYEDIVCNGLCSGGECVAYDSDGGLDYLVQGTCFEAEGESYTDECYCNKLGGVILGILY